MTDLSHYYNCRQSSSDLTVLVHSPLSGGGGGDVIRGKDVSAAHDKDLSLCLDTGDDGGRQRRGRSPDSETNSASSLLSKNTATTINSALLNDTLDSGFVTTKGSDKGESNMNDTFDSDNTASGGGGGGLCAALLSSRTPSCDQPAAMAAVGATIFDCELGCFISVEEYNRRYGHREKLWYEQ
jgi:hypothetical protein